jgi:uncharacterized protein (TIGR00255 family)
MTGFGAADGVVGPTRVSVEIRSVNHRFFNPSIKLPNELSRWEVEAREALRRGVTRGHVTLTARVERHNADDATGTAEEFVAIVARAVEALDRMRATEGAKLATYIEARLAIIADAVQRIADRAPQRLIEQRDRLQTAVQEIATGVTIDQQRLAQEVAFLADRLDVSEEISRFHAHLGAVASSLGSPPSDGVGKRLGFLLQELLREANTTGSKANDAAIVRDVILIKEELERIREQVENLE